MFDLRANVIRIERSYKLANVAAEEEIFDKGSIELHYPSDSPTIRSFIGYRKCLSYVPIFVNATVKPENQTLLHTFKVTVTDILIEGFIISIQRTDRSTGWQEKLIVDWVSYSESWLRKRNGTLTVDGNEWYAPGNGFMYSVQPEARYDAAQTVCRNISANLAVNVKDTSIRMKIGEYNRVKYLDALTVNRRKIWIGLTDRAQEDKWVWEDGTPLINSQANWWRTEPNGGTDQNCAALLDGEMVDVACTGLVRVLCERPFEV